MKLNGSKRRRMNGLDRLSVYLLTDRELAPGGDVTAVVAAALQAGIRAVQYREKELSTGDQYRQGQILAELVSQAGGWLIVNDRIDIALAVGAAGVHLGQTDLPLPIARRLGGAELIIGISVDTVAQAQQAEREGADYLGVGAIFPTATKPEAPVLGLARLAEITRAVSIPVIAIGGITCDRLQPLAAAGADGIAVVSAVMAAPDPFQAAAQLLVNWTAGGREGNECGCRKSGNLD